MTQDEVEQILRTLSDNMTMLSDVMGSFANNMSGVDRAARDAAASFGRARTASTDMATGFSGASEAARVHAAAQREAAKEVVARETARKASFNLAEKAVIDMVKAFGKATGEFSTFNGAIGSAGDAALALGRAFGPLGTILGGIVKGGTMLMQLQTKQADNLMKAYDSMAKFGTAGSLTANQLAELGHNARLTIADLDKLTKPMQSLGTGLTLIGTTTSQGAKVFADLVAVGGDTLEEFSRIGVSQEEVISGMADYVKLQQMSGRSISTEVKDREKLRKESLAYITNLQDLAEITGQDVDKIKKQQQEATRAVNWQVSQIQLENKARLLESQGRTEEAKKLRDEAKGRDQALQAISAFGGKAVTEGAREFMATGTVTGEGAQVLNRLGLTDALAEMKQNIGNGADAQKEALKFQDLYNKALGNAVEKVGFSGSISEEVAKQYGLTVEELEKYRARQGKTTEQLAQEAAAAREAKQKGLKEDSAAENNRAKLAKVTQETAVGFDKILNAANPLTQGLTAASLATAGLTAAAGLAAAALTGLAAIQGLGAVKGALGSIKGGPPAPAGGAAPRAGGAAARSVAKVAGRFLTKLFLPLAAGRAVYDAVQGFNADKDASYYQRISNAGSSAVNGASFGLVGSSPEEIAARKARQNAQENGEPNILDDRRKDKLEKTQQSSLDTLSDIKNILNKTHNETLTPVRISILKMDDNIESLTDFSISDKARQQELIKSRNDARVAAQTPQGSVPTEMPNVSSDLKKYLQATALIESGGNPNAKAKTSSAGGMFQFIDSTWEETTKRMGKNYTLQDKYDPAKATEVMEFFTKQQKAQLEKSTGQKVNNTDLYMAHFLGASGAGKFINAMKKDPSISAASLDPRAARANRDIYYTKDRRERSLAEVYKLMGQKMANAESAVETGKWGKKGIPDIVKNIGGDSATTVSTATSSIKSTSPVVGAPQPTELAKTPTMATTSENAESTSQLPSAIKSAPTDTILKDLYALMDDKLSQMISAIEDGNSTRENILKTSVI